MAKLISIYWRDIPAQVIGRDARRKVKRELEPRFQEAIDRAAMRAGRGSSDAYLADWRREAQAVSGELEALVADKVRELQERFPPELLERVVKAGGRAEDAPGNGD
jgi:hypothetical protein